jgi:hypothetical protein
MDKHTDRDAAPVHKPCCCPPHVVVWGSTSIQMVPLSNQMLEDEQLQVRADANASVSPPGGPQVSADGSGGSEIRTRLRKDVDMLALVVGYRFEWEARGQCQPLSVRVDIRGDVVAEIPCAPERGHSELVMRRVLAANEINAGPRGSATATVTVLDCSGQTVSCRFTLREG